MGFLSLQSIIPPGTIFPYAGSTAPDGWVLCQGQPVSRTSDTYKALFAAIGTAYGVGDNSTTFNLPNTQGYFLRGAGTTGIYSQTRGVVQADAFGSHRHTPQSTGPTPYFIQNGGGDSGTFNWVGTGGSFQRASATDFAGASETRPANVGVNYIIKL